LRNNKAILIAYLGFVTLGSFDGLLGVIWPAMSRSLGVPLEALGILLMVALAGFVLVSFNSGSFIRARGLHWFLLTSLIVRALAYGTIAIFPSWPMLIIMIFVMSIGAGGIDAGLNIFVAARGNTRQINWLHACYGIGATAGPFLAAGVLAAGGDWTWNFAVIGAFMAVIAILVWRTSSYWGIEVHIDGKSESQGSSVKIVESLRLPVVWVSTLLFFFYVGTELSAGQWGFSLFNLGRGMPDLAAKFWIGIYWGIFTVGRVLFGLVADKVRIDAMLRSALVASAAGATFLLWNPGGYGFLGLVLMGLAQAPVYPSLIAATISRVGRQHAPNAIGFQGAAGGVGGTTMSSLIGVLTASFGFEMIAISVVALSLLTFLAHEILLITAQKNPLAA
jgi:fucose permease